MNLTDFILNSILLGAGLAMDAFSVSLTNGLNQPDMPRGRMAGIAGIYAFFQFLMPMIGWGCVHTIVGAFQALEKAVPWIAFILLGLIGGKMLVEGIRESRGKDGFLQRTEGENGPEDTVVPSGAFLSAGMLLAQGIATSIDALSVGFTIADYGFCSALFCALIIAAVTFLICIAGLRVGRFFGLRLSGHASVLGGLILIFIGVRILLRH